MRFKKHPTISLQSGDDARPGGELQFQIILSYSCLMLTIGLPLMDFHRSLFNEDVTQSKRIRPGEWVDLRGTQHATTSHMALS